jgi:hypothetical protein
MKHSDACNLVRLAVSEAGGLALPYNTGALEDANGRLIKFGLPGASDLIACVAGRAFFIEVKVGKDAWRTEQRKFADAVERTGGRYVLARFPGGIETVKAALLQDDTICCPFCGSAALEHGTRDDRHEGVLFCRNCNLGGDFVEPSNDVWLHHDRCSCCGDDEITKHATCANCGAGRITLVPVRVPC